jgi:hypothetical protein
VGVGGNVVRGKITLNAATSAISEILPSLRDVIAGCEVSVQIIQRDRWCHAGSCDVEQYVLRVFTLPGVPGNRGNVMGLRISLR